jgi:hypothetical protein
VSRAGWRRRARTDLTECKDACSIAFYENEDQNVFNEVMQVFPVG